MGLVVLVSGDKRFLSVSISDVVEWTRGRDALGRPRARLYVVRESK